MNSHSSSLFTDLWDDGDSGPEVMEAQLSDVQPINEDVAFSSLDDPEQAESEGGFSCSSSPHNSHLQRGVIYECTN